MDIWNKKIYDEINVLLPQIDQSNKILADSINNLKDILTSIILTKQSISDLLEKWDNSGVDCEWLKEELYILDTTLKGQISTIEFSVGYLLEHNQWISWIYDNFNRYKKQAYIDNFTWLYNNLKLKETIKSLQWIDLQKSNVCISFIQIDNLKKINEEFSFELWNDLIRAFSFLLWNFMWKYWLIYHLKWNEFVLIKRFNWNTRDNSIDSFYWIHQSFQNHLCNFKSLFDVNEEHSFKYIKLNYLFEDVESLDLIYRLLKDVYKLNLSFSSFLSIYDWEDYNTLISNWLDNLYKVWNNSNWNIVFNKNSNEN